MWVVRLLEEFNFQVEQVPGACSGHSCMCREGGGGRKGNIFQENFIYSNCVVVRLLEEFKFKAEQVREVCRFRVN